MVLQILLIQNFVTFKAVAQIAECPPSETIPGCPCYNFEDGLFLECAGATEETLKTTLQSVLSISGKYKQYLLSQGRLVSLKIFKTTNRHMSKISYSYNIFDLIK